MELKDLRQLAQRSSLAEKVAELKTGHVSGVRALTAVTGGRVRLGSGLLSQPRERGGCTQRDAQGVRCLDLSDAVMDALVPL